MLALVEQLFNSFEDVKKWVDDWIAAKDEREVLLERNP